MVRSVKNANKITAAGLEGYPASGKGRLSDVTDSSTASSFPVFTGPHRLPLPSQSEFLGVFLPCLDAPGKHPELRSPLLHHGGLSL